MQSVGQHDYSERLLAERQRRRARDHEPRRRRGVAQPVPRHADRGSGQVHREQPPGETSELRRQLSHAAADIEQPRRTGVDAVHRLADEPMTQDLGGAATVVEWLPAPVHLLEQPGALGANPFPCSALHR